ncbi:MAG: carbohydrate kinase family protein [Halobacteriales archaeon]
MSDPAVVCVGNALIDHTYSLTNLPAADDGAYVLDAEDRFGGVETNVAAILSSLGIESGVITRLGDDADGRAVANHLDELDLDTTLVREGRGEETSYCLVLTAEGERVIIGGGESALAIDLGLEDRAYLESASVVFASAYAPPRVISDLAELDVPFAFDLAGRFADLEHRGLSREQLDATLPGIDLFIANQTTAQSYLQSDGEPAALADGLRARGVTRGVVTDGMAGALLFDDHGTYPIEALEVEVVDTTGAGDAFTAGLIAAWFLEERSPAAAGRFAAAAAAANCTVRGAHTAPPTREAIRALLAE